MQTNSTYIRVLASALSSTYGVKVEESDTWAFDSSKKILKYNPITLLEKNVNVVRGLLIHEIGHVVYTQPVPSSDIYKEYPIINLIYNAFEDIRIEEQSRKDYGEFSAIPLMTKNVTYVGEFFKDNELRKSNKAFQVGAIGVMVDLMMLVTTSYYGRYYAYDDGFNKFMNEIQRIEAKLEKYVDQDVHEAAQVIQQKEDWRKLRALAQQATSFGDIQKLVDKKIFPYIKHLLEGDPDNEAMKQKIQQMLQQKQQQKQQSGGKSDDPVDGDSDTNTADGEGTQPADSDEEVMADVDVSSATEDPGKGNTSDRSIPFKTPNYPEASAMMSPYSNFLASRIKDIMKENASVRFHGNHKHGKLMSRNVTKIALGEERVFSKRNQVDSPNYHLIIALDSSGSMSGEKETNAYLGTVMAVDTFKKIRMKSTVVDFGEEVNVLLDGQMAHPNFFDYRSQGGGTDDAEMIYWVYDYMKARPDEDFFFLILGDGQGTSLPQRELEYIKEHSIPMAIGIGRDSSSVVKAYPGGVRVDEISRVPNTILNRLHDAIHR